MSQFRKTGTRYVSQWNGDDVNAGTGPTLPWKTLFSTITTSQVIGAGVYSSVGTGVKNLIGDGKVVLKGITFGTTTYTVEGLYFDVCIATTLLLGGTDCVFKDGIFGMRGSTAKIRWVIVGDADLRGSNTGNIQNSIFALSSGAPDPSYSTSPVSNVTDAWGYNFVSKNSKIRLYPVSGSYLAHSNCCINGLIQTPAIDLVWREAKFLIDGSPRPDADPLIDDIAGVFPNFYSQGNFACEEEDVKFIDIISRTVEPDSVLLQKSNANGYIGGVKVGRKIDLDESGFTISKTGIDDSNPNFWKIAVGVDYAKIRITGKVSDSLISAQTLDIRIPFNFDGDAVGGTADNNNVPDAWNARTALDTKGELPNRLTFEVRSSQLTNPGRDVSADWDNDNTNNPSIAGQYYLMEYGQPMLHHVVSAVAYGNADAAAINAATKLPFNYRSLDIIITITNTREI